MPAPRLLIAFPSTFRGSALGFESASHLNYSSHIVPIEDGRPKYREGGAGQVLARTHVRTHGCTLTSLTCVTIVLPDVLAQLYTE